MPKLNAQPAPVDVATLPKRRETASSAPDALLDATSALLAERNSIDVTFVEIAERSGVNSALIKYHFDNKLGLFKALLERDAGPAVDGLAQLVEADMPAARKLHHHIAGIIKTYYVYPYMNRLVGALSMEADSDMARFIAERFTLPLARAQAAILEQGVREGAFREVDPMLFHFSLVGACDHLFYARHSLKHAFHVEEVDDELRKKYAEHVAGIVLAGIQRQ